MNLYKIKNHDVEEYSKESVLETLKISEKEFELVLKEFSGKDYIRLASYDDVYISFHTYFLKKSIAIERLLDSMYSEIVALEKKTMLIKNIYDGLSKELETIVYHL
jgi:hypothetical protein